MAIDRQFVVTPSDTVDDPAANGHGFVLYVGTSGDVKVTTTRGAEILLKNLAAGYFHNFYVRRVWSTGTTATDIIGGQD